MARREVPNSHSIKNTGACIFQELQICAAGCGAHEANRQVTKIPVRMLVRLTDLRVEILEQSAQGSTSFETAGSHRGNLSDDLQRIDAQWTTRASGQRGQLHLRAVLSAVCAPAASL
jgi:hypothetical protein